MLLLKLSYLWFNLFWLLSSTRSFEMLHSKLPTMTSIPIPPKKWLKSRIHYYKFQKKLLLHFEQTAILVKVTQVVQWWFARDSTLGFKLELSAMDWRFVFQFAKMDCPKMTLGVLQITRDTLEEGWGEGGKWQCHMNFYAVLISDFKAFGSKNCI